MSESGPTKPVSDGMGAAGSRAAIVLPTVEELCEAMAATGDRPGFTVTREANGFPVYAAAVLAMLKERADA